MTEVDITKRTFDFSVRVLKLCKILDQNPGTNRMIANQLVRSGTSIGVNVEEAQAAQSKPDFISKLSIACKEARETLYWLRLLTAADIIPEGQLKHIITESNQLVAILTSIIKKSRS